MTRYWLCNAEGNGPTADLPDDDAAREWARDYSPESFDLLRRGAYGWHGVDR